MSGIDVNNRLIPWVNTVNTILDDGTLQRVISRYRKLDSYALHFNKIILCRDDILVDHLLAMTQHAGLVENVTDHRLNSRTVYINPVFRFLYLNMNYHVEHHVFPMVPFHALPKLHEEIGDRAPPAYDGLWAVYRELVPVLIRQARTDPDHHIRRALPETASA